MFLAGPTCKKMCDLTQKAVFRAIAFMPTEEELQAATRRNYPGPARNESRLNQASSSRKVPPAKPKPREFVMELSDSSDDELPDPLSIIRDHKSGQKDQDKGKGKGKSRGSSDDVGTSSISAGE